jgi:hypothetical protein
MKVTELLVWLARGLFILFVGIFFVLGFVGAVRGLVISAGWWNFVECATALSSLPAVICGVIIAGFALQGLETELKYHRDLKVTRKLQTQKVTTR